MSELPGVSGGDGEGGGGGHACVGALHRVDHAKPRLEALAVEVEERVAAPRAVAVLDVRVRVADGRHALRVGALRGDRSAAELRRDHGRIGLLRTRVEVGDEVRVHVAAQHHGVRGAALRERLQQPRPRPRVAVPAVGPVLHAPGALVPRGRHERLLHDEVPARLRGRRIRRPASAPAPRPASCGLPACAACTTAPRRCCRRARPSGTPGGRGTGDRRARRGSRGRPTRGGRRGAPRHRARSTLGRSGWCSRYAR